MKKIFFMATIFGAICLSHETQSAKWEEVKALAIGENSSIAIKTNSYLKKYSAVQLTELIKTIPAKELTDKKNKPTTINVLLEVLLSKTAGENKMEDFFSSKDVNRILKKMSGYRQLLFNLQNREKISAQKLEIYRTKTASTHNLSCLKTTDYIVGIGQKEEKKLITISHNKKVAACCLNHDGSICATITENGEIFVWKKNKNNDFALAKYFDSKIFNAKTIAFGGTGKHLLITDNDASWLIGGYYEFKPRTYAVITLLKSRPDGITMPAEKNDKKSWLARKYHRLNNKLNLLEYPAKIIKAKKDATTNIFKLISKKVA